MGSSVDALEFEAGTRVHFVGIGGVSMSALAELMHHRGHTVTGSDKQASELTDRLGAMGLGIHIGHIAEAVEDTDMVVYTSAASDENPEILRAREDHIPLMKRSEFLGRLTAGKRLVGVAGTHGKTTTTAMVGAVLEAADLDPTVLVGGLVTGNEQNLRLGSQSIWAVEADEFDRSFLTLHPEVSVVTNLEADHLDCYRDLQEIQSAFGQYLNQTSCAAVLCVDSPLVSELQVKKPGRKIEYGIGLRAQLRADEIESKNFTSTIRIRFQNEELGNLFLQVPGLHNVRNALAAVGVGISLDLDWEAIRTGLESFRGVRRRFEILGEVDGVKVVSDYAHHPTEIRAVLEAARAEWSGRLVAVFQPHLYSRTRDFMAEFAGALQAADLVVVADVYAAREQPIDGINAEGIVRSMRASGFEAVKHIGPTGEIAGYLTTVCRRGDLVITLGAGDIDAVASDLLAALSRAN